MNDVEEQLEAWVEAGNCPRVWFIGRNTSGSAWCCLLDYENDDIRGEGATIAQAVADALKAWGGR